MLKFILIIVLAFLVVACQVDNLTASQEEQEIDTGLQDLEDLDKLTVDLDEDVTLNELENLELE